MLTGRSLTVYGEGGGWCIPEEILGKKIWIKKILKKKIELTPEKLETPTPRKIGDPRDQTPPHPCGQNHRRL